MSYTIEYDRQFLRSERGITPCWNAGDNNVTQYVGRREVRSRDWCLFHNLLGVTEQEMLDAIQPFLGGYNEHWRKNGKWVTDDMLIRWVKNGCKSAASIEDVLFANHMSSVRAYVSVWSKELKNEVVLDRHIATTEELDTWIDAVRLFQTTAEGKGTYPVIELCYPYSKLAHPKKQDAKKPGLVLIKAPRYGYLVEITPGGSTRWTKDIRHAHIFPYDDAEATLAAHHIGGAKLVNAMTTLGKNAYNAVIKNKASEEYIRKISSTKVHFAHSPNGARRYPSVKAAEQALERLAGKWDKAAQYIVTEI